MRPLRISSLRARLLVGLVVLAAIGLVIAGWVTYSEERSFLLGQVNSELLGSFNSVEDQLDHQNGFVGVGLAGPPGGAQTNLPYGGHGPPGEQQIDPAGTFGEHLDRFWRRVGKPLAYGFASQYGPMLPRDLTPYISTPLHQTLFTVPAAGAPGQSFRVLVRPADVGYGLTVVGISLAGTDASLSRLETVEAIVIASVLAALALLAWIVIRIGLRPLDRIAATAGAIAAGDLTRRVSPADERTEVGRLGLALNAMLGQIEQAFAKRAQSEERLRRFLSDAAHELRTPLTSIRGYAELFRRGALATPDDAATAMARIEHEAARMGILVEQLLALARLDELPEGVREPVDLAPLVADAGADARAVAPDREVTVKITPAGSARHVVNGDAHELRQVLANLTSNAIKHTPAGTPIALTLTRRDGRERIAVRDHGPGLPADAQDAVFERFWRSEAGRERGRAGAGLGLAIVAEIVEAHGGRVSASNAPGGGALFEIELPSTARSAAGRRRG